MRARVSKTVMVCVVGERAVRARAVCGLGGFKRRALLARQRFVAQLSLKWAEVLLSYKIYGNVSRRLSRIVRRHSLSFSWLGVKLILINHPAMTLTQNNPVNEKMEGRKRGRKAAGAVGGNRDIRRWLRLEFFKIFSCQKSQGILVRCVFVSNGWRQRWRQVSVEAIFFNLKNELVSDYLCRIQKTILKHDITRS